AGDADVDGDVEGGGGEVGREGRARVDVAEKGFGGGVEEDLAVEAGEPPLVLVLNEGGVGPLDDEGDEFVFAVGSEGGGEVEFGGEAGVLGEADGDAVEVDGEHAGGAAEVDDDASAGPSGGDGEGAAIDAGGVIGGDVRRLVGPRHLHVGVVGFAVALGLEITGDGDRAPRGGGGEGGALGEAQGVFGGGLAAELPFAAEREHPGGLVGVAGQCLLRGGEVGEGRAGRELVERGELGVFPSGDEAGFEHGAKGKKKTPVRHAKGRTGDG